MRLAIVCVLVGCGADVPAPSEARPAALCRPVHDLVVATEALDRPADSTAPRHYRLSDGRVLTEDRYRDQLAIGEVSLGRARLEEIPRVGWIAVAGDRSGNVTFSDIDPKQAKLRELFRTSIDAAAEPIGTLDGAIALLTRGPADRRTQITCISGPGDVTTVAIDLPAGTRVADGDAIREHRLLVGEWPQSSSRWEAPFEIGVAIVDLDSRKWRSLGDAEGHWTQWTNVPQPSVTLWWSDDARLGEPPQDTALVTVDVHSERLRRAPR